MEIRDTSKESVPVTDFLDVLKSIDNSLKKIANNYTETYLRSQIYSAIKHGEDAQDVLKIMRYALLELDND